MTLFFAFGEPAAEAQGGWGLGLPLLAGDAREDILAEAGPSGRDGDLSLWRAGDALAGWARADPARDPEGVTGRLYGQVLRAARGLNLYRIWNTVPRINAEDPAGLENYRAFCRGRSLAFEEALGTGFARRLPASTAVGTDSREMAVAFIAGSLPARHVENPAQIPAYEYPPEHGPRPPSFARATVVERDGRADVYVSGTSSILGHATVAPLDTAGQVACTLENMRRVMRACGLGDTLQAANGRRHFKVYLRNAGDQVDVARLLGEGALVPGDRVSYLRADICRVALNVEIEVSVRGAERS